MKMFGGIAAAAMIVMTGLAPAAIVTPAAAQRTVVHERVVVRHGPTRHARYRYRNRRICSYQYRHHHRFRVCRNVRHRYRY